MKTTENAVLPTLISFKGLAWTDPLRLTAYEIR